MYDALGVNWAGTLLGCVAILLVPIPIIFYKYGAKIRQKSKFAPTYPKPMGSETMSNGDAAV
jgi:DHA1 family multidrug resistance protein-like MFS transporter